VEGQPRELEALRKSIGGSLSGTILTKRISTSDPSKALDQLRAVSTAVKAAEKNPKGFK
jgi:hypothetical protein